MSQVLPRAGDLPKLQRRWHIPLGGQEPAEGPLAEVQHLRDRRLPLPDVRKRQRRDADHLAEPGYYLSN